MKTKERYDSDAKDLKGYYKHVYTCEECGISYGHDSDKKIHNLCPFCERDLYSPRGVKKKDE